MFEWRQNGKFKYQVYPAWERIGVRHGFIGASSNFRDAVLAENSREFCASFNTSRLVVLNQVHGNELVTLPELGARADGIYIPAGATNNGAYAIRAADCLAVFIRSRSGFAIVHAGWRGLAAGMIERAVSVLEDPALEAVCWPCAGSEVYQVGSEVIDAIGDDAVHRVVNGKITLNLAASAAGKIRKIAPQAQIVESGLCTISNTDFHSYRRDGEDRGSNLAFLIT